MKRRTKYNLSKFARSVFTCAALFSILFIVGTAGEMDREVELNEVLHPDSFYSFRFFIGTCFLVISGFCSAAFNKLTKYFSKPRKFF